MRLPSVLGSLCTQAYQDLLFPQGSPRSQKRLANYTFQTGRAAAGHVATQTETEDVDHEHY